MPQIILTIAGSDSSGGAGIQADLKTIAAHGCYGTSAITALTAQNTRGVAAIHTPPAEFLAAQLQSVLSDFPPAAVKLGMLPNAACVRAAAEALRGLSCPIIIDPVMVATSGAALSESEAVKAMQELLFPLAALITPNLREAEALSGLKIASEAHMEAAAQAIGYPVLVKGGHMSSDAAKDFLCCQEEQKWFSAPRLDIGDTHGTGCTLSTAIACRLGLGHSLSESVKLSKLWLTWLLKEKPDFGVPNGPLQHR